MWASYSISVPLRRQVRINSGVADLPGILFSPSPPRTPLGSQVSVIQNTMDIRQVPDIQPRDQGVSLGEESRDDLPRKKRRKYIAKAW